MRAGLGPGAGCLGNGAWCLGNGAWYGVRGLPEVVVEVRPEVEDRPVDGDLPVVEDLPVVAPVVAVRPAEWGPVRGEPVLGVVQPKLAVLLLWRLLRRED